MADKYCALVLCCLRARAGRGSVQDEAVDVIVTAMLSRASVMWVSHADALGCLLVDASMSDDLVAEMSDAVSLVKEG